jgi:flavorubredoxin
MNTALRENIDWVGYVDWSVRDFHGYNTARGATYNSYLVRDEKTALIDAVKAPFADELLKNIAALTDPAAVRYVVCNHAEPDHASGLSRVMAALPAATLVCDQKCALALSQHHDTSSWKIQIVATGDTVSLGRRTLQFLETPMVHWPESMFTYVPEEKLLFSMDAFGQHYATSQRFDDQVSLATMMDEARTYYANILMPFGRQVAALLKKTAKLDLTMIAPAHGVIWRKHAPMILEAYRNWADCRPQPKVLVIYDTMWNSTGQMARAILAGATAGTGPGRYGVEAQLIHVRHSNLTRIATEVLDAAAIAFGCSTLNQGLMPMAAAVLTYLKGLRPVGKVGLAFGSYGWSAGGPEAVDEYLQAMKWEVLRAPLKAQYRPTPEVLEECHAAGRILAEKARQMGGDRQAGERFGEGPSPREVEG